MPGYQHEGLHPRRRKLDSVRSDINVTPLVDVCLVLLIIFMVVMPAMSRGMEVKLPSARNVAERKDTSDQPIISLRMDNNHLTVYFDRDVMTSPDMLKRRIEDYLRRKPGTRMFLKADKNLNFVDVYPTLTTIQEAGSPGIELGTAEFKEGT